MTDESVFIDIGANIGHHTLVAAKQTSKNGKVYAFEPLAHNFDSLKANIALNPYTNISAYNLAVSNEIKTIVLYTDPHANNLGAASEFNKSSAAIKATAETTTLDSFFESNKPEWIDLIKLDIEGGELPALQGMKQTLIDFKPVLMIEFDEEIMNKSPYSEHELETFLIDLDYKKFFLSKRARLTTDKHESITKNLVFKHHKDIQKGTLL